MRKGIEFLARAVNLIVVLAAFVVAMMLTAVMSRGFPGGSAAGNTVTFGIVALLTLVLLLVPWMVFRWAVRATWRWAERRGELDGW